MVDPVRGTTVQPFRHRLRIVARPAGKPPGEDRGIAGDDDRHDAGRGREFLLEMLARAADDDEAAGPAPLLDLDADAVAVAMRPPVHGEQVTGHARGEFELGQRDVVLVAGRRRPGDVAVREHDRVPPVEPLTRVAQDRICPPLTVPSRRQSARLASSSFPCPSGALTSAKAPST